MTGDRRGSDVSLRFEFDRYNPIDFEGTVQSRQIQGRVYGSGLNGELLQLYRY